MNAEYADLDAIAAWAEELMASRPPDFVIGDDYLRRWWVIPRSEGCNVYLHDIRKSDDDRALHDHPWPNTSMIIRGGYIEHTPEGSFVRKAGDIVSRLATATHRLEIPEGESCISLFITGAKEREWGFHCPKGWVHWKIFTDESGSKTGRGCGEDDIEKPAPPYVGGFHGVEQAPSVYDVEQPAPKGRGWDAVWDGAAGNEFTGGQDFTDYNVDQDR